MSLLLFSFLLLFKFGSCGVSEERIKLDDNSEIHEIGHSSFDGIWIDDSNIEDGHSSKKTNLFDGFDSHDKNAYSTSFVDIETGMEFEKTIIDVEKLFKYNIDSNVIGEFTTPSDPDNTGDNNDDQNRRNLVILGADTRAEETGAPPTSGRERYTVCIGFTGCSRDCCCSGYVIDTEYVLTAGHCLHSGGSSGGWYSGVKVWPRRTRFYTPSSISASSLTVWSEWYNNANYAYDMGWIKLSSSAGVGWGAFGWSSSLAINQQFSHFGYPGDKTDGSMWQSTGDLSWVSTFYLLTDTTDTVGGHSGGPWYRTSNNVVYAVHRGGSTTYQYNIHIRMTESRFNVICNNYLVNSC